MNLRQRSNRLHRGILGPALLIVVLLALTACAGADTSSDQAESVPVGEPAEDVDLEAPLGAVERSAASTAEAYDEDAAGDDGGGTDAAEDTGGVSSGLPVGNLPEVATGDKVIKEGTVTIAVEAGSFDTALNKVVEVAARLGGGMIASTTATTDTGAASGSVTVRVPVDQYDSLLVGVDDIGEVRSRDVRAQDVTGEYTDLESRLRHLEAQERFYLELMEEAGTIQEAITVRQQLDSLQGEIEQVKGRLQLLDSRTAFSLLTVELFEPDAPPGTIEVPGARPSLAQWWASAQDALVNVIGVMMVVVFFLAPLTIPALLLAVAWRSLRPRPAVPAAPEAGA